MGQFHSQVRARRAAAKRPARGWVVEEEVGLATATATPLMRVTVAATWAAAVLAPGTAAATMVTATVGVETAMAGLVAAMAEQVAAMAVVAVAAAEVAAAAVEAAEVVAVAAEAANSRFPRP